MSDDPRCCGSGTCIIDSQGRCWCGQQWDGVKTCHAPIGQAEPQRAAPPGQAQRAADADDYAA